MATGPEHYLEAERLLEQANVIQHDNGPDCGSEEVIAEAQVHATLALAAATAMASPATRSGMHNVDYDAWDKVCGGD